MSKVVRAAFAAAAIFAGVTVAQAEEAQMRVQVADLNLATDAGAKVALARIRFSAGSFCEQDAGRQSLDRTAVVDRCVTAMTEKGVQGLNAPMVTALLRGKAPARPQTELAMAQ